MAFGFLSILLGAALEGNQGHPHLSTRPPPASANPQQSVCRRRQRGVACVFFPVATAACDLKSFSLAQVLVASCSQHARTWELLCWTWACTKLRSASGLLKGCPGHLELGEFGGRKPSRFPFWFPSNPRSKRASFLDPNPWEFVKAGGMLNHYFSLFLLDAQIPSRRQGSSLMPWHPNSLRVRDFSEPLGAPWSEPRLQLRADPRAHGGLFGPGGGHPQAGNGQKTFRSGFLCVLFYFTYCAPFFFLGGG